MSGLYNSTVQAQHLVQSVADSVTSWSWAPYGDARDSIRCRLDLTFVRPGKDILPAIEAGKAPDRIGVLFADPKCGLRAGDRIVATAGPITGIFEIRAIPDLAQDYFTAHHMEVQIIETAQQLDGIFPSEQGGVSS